MFLGILAVILPIVYAPRSFTIIETENISLEPVTADPDNDPVIITYSKPLNEHGFWQTTYGDAGNYTIFITVSDGKNNATEIIELYVRQKMEPPSIQSYTPKTLQYAVNEGETLNFAVTAADVNKDNLTYTWELDGETVSQNSAYSYGPDYQSAGAHQLAVVISDGIFEEKIVWDIEVIDTDTPPVFAEIAPIFIAENAEVFFGVNATDPDGDEVVVSAQTIPEGALFEDGIFRWRPSFDAVRPDTSEKSWKKKFRILREEFIISFRADSSNQTTLQQVKIVVGDVNVAPVLEKISPVTIKEGNLFVLNISSFDPDGDRVRITYDGWMQSPSYTPTYDDAGIHYVKITASDGIEDTAQLVKIIVEDVNQPPTIAESGIFLVAEGELLTIPVKVFDSDTPTLDISLPNPPLHSELTGNVITWTPSFDTVQGAASKKIPIQVAVSDKETTIFKDLVVEVRNVNQKPSLDNFVVTPLPIKVNQPALFELTATDPDNDPLTYEWDFGMFEKYAGSSRHQRTFASAGQKKVTVTASDGRETVQKTFTFDVIE